MTCKKGVIHGRFQGLHLGHLEYLEAALQKCDFLYIGITNYDITEEKKINNSDENRFLRSSNPFTYYERCEMIKVALLEKGYDLNRFCFVPFPIDNFLDITSPEDLKRFKRKMFNFVPEEAVYFITIYDDWGRDKYNKLLKLVGEDKVDLMWVRSLEEKPISGTKLRNAIINNEDWSKYVVPSVYRYIKENKLDERIKNER